MRCRVSLEHELGVLHRLVVIEALVVAVDLTVGRQAHGHQIPRRAHLDGGSIGDPGKDVVDVVRRD